MSTRPVLPAVSEPADADLARARASLADYRRGSAADLHNARCHAVGYLTCAIEAIAEQLSAGDLAGLAGTVRRCRAFDAALAEFTGGRTARQDYAGPASRRAVAPRDGSRPDDPGGP